MALTATNLYLFLIIALMIIGPIALVLWRRYSPQLIYAQGQGEVEEAGDDPSVPMRVAAFEVTASRSSTPKIELAPLEAVVTQLLQTTPHIGIIGDTGAGKTTTGEAILRVLTGEAYVIDPKWFQGKWGALAAATIEGAGDQVSYAPIAQGLKSVFAEFNRRRLQKQTQPDIRFKDLWVVWDETNDVMEEVDDAGTPFRRLLRIGREYNVHLLFFPQSDRVKALGLEGHGDAMKNVLWIYLGNDARDVVKRLAKEKRIDSTTEQYLMSLERPAVVAHSGHHYAVDLSHALYLSLQPMRHLESWTVPVPSSQAQENLESTLGTPELPVREPSKKLPDMREAAIRYWISQGLKDTPIAERIDMRKQEALLLVKEVRLKIEAETTDNALHILQKELIETPIAA